MQLPSQINGRWGFIAAAVVGWAAAGVAAASAPWSCRHSWPGWGPPQSGAVLAVAIAAQRLKMTLASARTLKFHLTSICKTSICMISESKRSI